jgi:hypothetical protein
LKPRNSKLLYGNVRWGDSGILYDGKFYNTKFYHQNICQQAIFYHRDLFQILGKFDFKYRLVADWVFNMRAFGLKQTKPVFIDTIVADFCAEGMSTGVPEEIFYRDRDEIFRNCFGKMAFFQIVLKDFFKSLRSSTSKKQ